MSLFSFGKSAPAGPADKVWKTRKACLKGMVMQSLLALKNSQLPVVVTFFEESHIELLEFLKSSGVPYAVINTLSASEILQLKGTVCILDVFSASSPGINIPKEVRANIFFLGHYPFVAAENKIVQSLQVIQPDAKLTFCLSLDDALFDQSGTGNLAPLLENIGLTDDECIEHAMVTKVIHRTLEKLNKKMVSEIKARSQREWFARNVKSN